MGETGSHFVFSYQRAILHSFFWYIFLSIQCVLTLRHVSIWKSHSSRNSVWLLHWIAESGIEAAMSWIKHKRL